MNDKVKLTIAVVCLSVAALVIVWQMGLFSGGSGSGGTASNDDIDATPTTIEDTSTVTDNPNGTATMTLDRRVVTVPE